MEAAPAIPPEVFEVGADDEPTEAALDARERLNDARLIHGLKGWLQVARICRWAQARVGEKLDLDCPPPTGDTTPP